jgi:serine/threonine protein kinase
VGKLADSAASVEIGAVLLGKYRIEKLIGRGGMGIVVKARHLGLDNPVAIKLLRDDVLIDDETITRFVREAKAAGRLRSEHVAQVTDVGTFPDGKPFMVMDFLEGEDLGQLIKEQGRINPQLAVDLVIQACDGLAEAHSLNIVHRDVKPTNLFVTWRSDGTPLVQRRSVADPDPVDARHAGLYVPRADALGAHRRRPHRHLVARRRALRGARGSHAVRRRELLGDVRQGRDGSAGPDGDPRARADRRPLPAQAAGPTLRDDRRARP